MAKRRPQSTANDSSTVAAAPKPKASRATAPRRSLATAPEPTEEAIRQRAYLRYLERGANDGDAFDDWLYAERELKKS
jgi:hypothetical protein